MGHDLAELTGASVPVGTTLESKVAPLTMRDWGELEAWMKQRPFALLNGQCGIAAPVLTPNEREAAVVEAVRISLSIGVFNLFGKQILQSPEGAVTWLFLSMRAKDPRATWDQAASVFNMHGLDIVLKVLADLNGIKETNQGNVPEPGPQSPGEKSSNT